MFTGIIEGLGHVSAIQTSGQGKRFVFDAGFLLDGTRIGDSVAVNGACLTVVRISGSRFDADLSAETLSKTTFGLVKTGDRVNLERALRLSDRIDGHLVSGHIDGVGRIRDRKAVGNAILFEIEIPESLSRYLIRKGSVAVDGISLTVNGCWPEGFAIGIIPHTAKLTTLALKQMGDFVNIETDMIGKYVERFVLSKKPDAVAEKPAVDMGLLARTGFLDPTR